MQVSESSFFLWLLSYNSVWSVVTEGNDYRQNADLSYHSYGDHAGVFKAVDHTLLFTCTGDGYGGESGAPTWVAESLDVLSVVEMVVCATGDAC